jgi:hypothetical protein
VSTTPPFFQLTDDQRTLQHTVPCADCPFRATALRGYLGGYPLRVYADPPRHGVPTSCHCRDHGARDARTALCAGSLAVMANSSTVPRHGPHAQAMRAVGRREDCHASLEQFRAHHASADRYVTESAAVALDEA